MTILNSGTTGFTSVKRHFKLSCRTVAFVIDLNTAFKKTPTPRRDKNKAV